MRSFDLQVNGYGGVDFNQDDLSPEDLHAACQRLADDGVEGILATIITESLDKMAARLRRLVDLRETDALAKRLIAGVHIEGPFINPQDGYRGAHPLDAVQPATVDEALRLLDAAAGLARIVTMAPEQDRDLLVTRRLVSEKVTVSAGHCNPSLDELRAAIDAGLSMFTHLGNGCPMQMHRHDNVIQRVLTVSDRLWVMFIADGAHIPLFARWQIISTWWALIGQSWSRTPSLLRDLAPATTPSRGGGLGLAMTWWHVHPTAATWSAPRWGCRAWPKTFVR